jgi:hypothetical protein
VGCDVYANSNAVACKAGDAKVIASFPDVCLSPPSPPAGPIPVPYPNTSFDKDMQNGSKTVMIKGQEVMLKDQSFYKTSPLGDEAATNGLGASVVTHVITGKTYFQAWSMDVQFEGQNVDRNLDLTGSNCASGPPSDVSGNISEASPSTDDNPICECCKKPQHPSQQGGQVVSEEEWYNLNEQIPADPPPPTPDPRMSPRDMARWPAMQQWEAQCAENQARRQALNRRQRIVAASKKCPSHPKPPCNVYRKITSEQKDMAEAEWGQVSNEYKERKKVPYVPAQKRDPKTGHKIPERAKVHHNVPKSAGGCPTGDGNLTPSNEQSKACNENDDQLGDVQKECAEKWDAEIKAATGPA